MLTAFDYYEQIEKMVPSLKNPYLLEQELNIIQDFTGSIDHIGNQEICCPFCGEKNKKLFFSKWKVDYYRCEKCLSIYANINGKIMERYKNNKALISLRLNEQYQIDTSDRRRALWDDLLDWYTFRCFRYLGKNRDLEIIDYGTRYRELIHMLKDSGLAHRYELYNSIIKMDLNKEIEHADVILCMDYIQQEEYPLQFLKKISLKLKKNGLLFFSIRMGSGIDVLTLKENNKSIFPFEFNWLPTPKGLKILFEQAGLEILELTTPGAMDVTYLHEHVDLLEGNNSFLYYFLKNARIVDLSDFQRFIQKSGMSSYAQLVARKAK